GDGAEQAIEALAAFLAIDHDTEPQRRLGRAGGRPGRAGVSVTHAGIGVSPGRVVGPVARLAEPPELPATEPTTTEPEAEFVGATGALKPVAVVLAQRCAAVTGEPADVLAATAMIARDPMLADAVAAFVRAGRAAPWAIGEAVELFRAKLVAAGGY